MFAKNCEQTNNCSLTEQKTIFFAAGSNATTLLGFWVQFYYENQLDLDACPVFGEKYI